MKTGCGNNEKTEPSEFEIFHEISLEDGNYFLLITESTQHTAANIHSFLSHFNFISSENNGEK